MVERHEVLAARRQFVSKEAAIVELPMISSPSMGSGTVVATLRDVISDLGPPERRAVDGYPEWFVVQVKSQCERVLARDLAIQSVGYFLPMVRNAKGVWVLVFPGYLFVWGGDRARSEALWTGRACSLIKVVNQGVINYELFALEQGLASGTVVTGEEVKVGLRVQVRPGHAMEGMTGVASSVKKGRVLMRLSELPGAWYSVEIGEKWLEVLK